MAEHNKDYLGRKIMDLIEENEIKLTENEEILDIPVDKIYSNPSQPRTVFKEEALQELAESIKKHGVIQPVLLKPEKDYFVLVAGERRVRASKLAGRDTVPAVVRDYNTIYMAELSILENLQREDLSPIEEAIAYRNLIDKLGLSHQELAKKLGKSRSYVTNMLGLIRLPEQVIKAVNEDKLSMGHARVLSKLSEEKVILKLADKTINESLTVRELENVVRSFKKKKPLLKESEYLGVKKVFGKNVNISAAKNKLVIKFKNEKELKKALDHLERE